MLVGAAGSVLAGSNEVGQVESGVRYIPQEVVQGIKDRVVRFHTWNPKLQDRLITENIEAWFALREVPNSAAKRSAAENFPFQYAKQLYLAQRAS